MTTRRPPIFGPEPWAERASVAWSHWDLWFCLVCVLDADGDWRAPENEVAARAAPLRSEGFHGDPADDLIYATAEVMNLPLITGDRRIHEFEDRLPQRATRRAVWE